MFTDTFGKNVLSNDKNGACEQFALKGQILKQFYLYASFQQNNFVGESEKI